MHRQAHTKQKSCMQEKFSERIFQPIACVCMHGYLLNIKHFWGVFIFGVIFIFRVGSIFGVCSKYFELIHFNEILDNVTILGDNTKTQTDRDLDILTTDSLLAAVVKIGIERGSQNNFHSESELQKDFLRPVSGFSTKKCPNYILSEFCHNMAH